MEPIINYFLQPQNGILGIIVLVLGGVVLWEEKQKADLRKEIKELYEKRKTDSDTFTASYTAVAKEQVASTRDSINTIALLQKSIDSLVQYIMNRGKP